TVGELVEGNGVSVKINEIDAPIGTEFKISSITKLKAISDLQKIFSVADQGNDTGILSLTITGEDPVLIKKILNSISENYLAQNIARQAAQDQKSLEFLNQQ
ncbi:tyrosine-protein kinase, partial [Klebsiella pneumoniae]|nr:tyrosine-protein kinase [Klebsiella pneumoniae]